MGMGGTDLMPLVVGFGFLSLCLRLKHCPGLGGGAEDEASLAMKGALWKAWENKSHLWSGDGWEVSLA